MKSVLSSILMIAVIAVNAQSEVFKPSHPQIIYEMFIESVEPIHVTFDELNTTDSRPTLTSAELLKLHTNSRHQLETFHKDKIHHDAYNAALVYLDNMQPIAEELAPVLDAMKTANDESIAMLMEQLHDITIKEKNHAAEYRAGIRKVIDLFSEDWDNWLSDEVIYFSRLTAQERQKLYNSGLGENGLKAVSRRFYTADYFVLNMEQNATETRVNSIKATFHDLSELPDHMVQNVDDFLVSVEEPLLRYGYTKEVAGDIYTYTRSKQSVFEFNVQVVVVTVHSKTSNTVSIKFNY